MVPDTPVRGEKLFIIGGIFVALDGIAGIWLEDTIIFTIMIGRFAYLVLPYRWGILSGCLKKGYDPYVRPSFEGVYHKNQIGENHVEDLFIKISI